MKEIFHLVANDDFLSATSACSYSRLSVSLAEVTVEHPQKQSLLFVVLTGSMCHCGQVYQPHSWSPKPLSNLEELNCRNSLWLSLPHLQNLWTLLTTCLHVDSLALLLSICSSARSFERHCIASKASYFHN